MHRLILNAKKGQVVDHADHNGLNNTRKNIRLCDHSENAWNGRKRVSGKHPYKGIALDKRPLTKPWQAVIVIRGKSVWLGRWSTAEEAALAYNRAAKRYFGKFALLNKL